MRVGLSWQPNPDWAAERAWGQVVAEATTCDGLGFDSVWVHESRDLPSGCPSPSMLLTYLSRRTKNVLLVGHRELTHTTPVRLAEELGVLDNFCRGRAGMSFASAGSQGISPIAVNEAAEFVSAAMALDEFRFRGETIRFPSHTTDDAPAGVSTLPAGGRYIPQWERGPAMPDFLAITPKPIAPRPPTWLDVTDDESLTWAAQNGVSPFLPAAIPTADAVERLDRYRTEADAAGRRAWEVAPALERHMHVGGEDDGTVLGGNPEELVGKLRDLRDRGGVTHLIWRRRAPGDGDLFQFASQIQLLLQA